MRGQLQNLLILKSRELTEEDADNRVPEVIVTAELDRWLSSFFTRRICHELYATVTGIALDNLVLNYQRQVDPAEVRRRLARAFFERELVAVALEPVRVQQSGGGAAPGQSSAAPMVVPLLPDRPEKKPQEKTPQKKASEAKQKTQAETTWVGIELVDDSGKPVAGARYRLKLPDGSVREGTLDDNGTARVEGFAQGQCEISFPDLDAGSWSPH